MSKQILLIVGVAWTVVLIPPLARAKLNGSLSNSVSNFRRLLYSFDNIGGRHPQAHLRGMAIATANEAKTAALMALVSGQTTATFKP